jgi:hypothetical protein
LNLAGAMARKQTGALASPINLTLPYQAMGESQPVKWRSTWKVTGKTFRERVASLGGS